MKYLLFVIILTVILLSTVIGSENDLIIEVELDKEQYYKRENIYPLINFINNGNEPIMVYGLHPSLGFIKAIIHDDNNIKVERRGLFTAAYVWPPDGEMILPGDTLSMLYFELNGMYGNNPVTMMISRNVYLLYGKYEIQFEYNNYYDIENRKYNIVKSNTVQFEIVEPETTERFVYEQYEEAFLLKDNYPERSIKIFESLYDRYPGSDYIPTIVGEWRVLDRQVARGEKALEIITQLVEQHPNSFTALNIYKLYLSFIRIHDPEKSRSLLQDVIQRNPGTAIARYGKTLFREIK